MDEEALLKQFAAQFAHGPDDADDTDAAAAAQGADSTANQVADDADQSPATFDTQQFLNGLDAIFDRHTAATEAGPYLEQAMVDAENAGDEAGLLTVLNETMGFYRSQGRHKENQWIVQRALELAARMGLTTGTSEAWAITLINCATSMRAAKQYDQAEDLYHQAQSVCRHSLAPTDRRLAALHNNLSMLYSETNRPDKAELELREALRIIEASSVNPDADIDVSSSHTNLALTLLTEHKLEDAHWHAAKALEIYRTGHLEHSAHYASALAGFAQVCFAERRHADAVTGYRHALAVIEECYGKDTDYWRITADNLRQAEEEAAKAGVTVDNAGVAGDAGTPPPVRIAAVEQPGTGQDRCWRRGTGRIRVIGRGRGYAGRIGAGVTRDRCERGVFPIHRFGVDRFCGRGRGRFRMPGVRTEAGPRVLDADGQADDCGEVSAACRAYRRRSGGPWLGMLRIR